MTLKELNRVLDIRSELEKAEIQRENLVKASGENNLFAEEISLIDERADQLRTELSAEEVSVEMFISTIKDAQLAPIFRLRYIRGLLWKEIAYIMGDGCTADSARQNGRDCSACSPPRSAAAHIVLSIFQ